MNKKNAMYIIDKDYKIVYTNKYFKELYPQVKYGDICYKCITKVEHPCSECPIFKANNESNLYNLVNGEWVNAESTSMELERYGECNAITFKIWKENRFDDTIGSKVLKVINNVSKSNPDQAIFAQYLEEGYPVYYANQIALDLLGYNTFSEFDEACNHKFVNFIHKANVDDVNKIFNENVYEGMLYNFTYKLKLKNNTYIDVLEKGQIVLDDDNRLVIISLVNDLSKVVYSKSFTDIENKNLSDQNRLLRYVNEALPGGYHRCNLDDEATLIDMSDKFVEMLGFTRDEIKDKFDNKYLNLVYKEDIHIVKDAINKARKGEEISVFTYRVIHKNEDYIWVKDTNQKCTYNGITFIQSTILDISDEMNKQFALENRNKQLALIADNIPCGFKILYDDEKFTFKFVSKECANLFGYTVEEFLKVTEGNSYGFCVESDSNDISKQLDECFKTNSSTYHIKFRVKCKDGTLKKVIDCGRKGIDKYGNSIFYSYCIDITEGEDNKDIITLQNELLEQEREKIIEKEKSIQQMELIYTLSKDFNTVYYMNIYTEQMEYLYSREAKYTKETIEEYYKDNNYTTGINHFIDGHVHPDDRDKVRKELAIETIRQKIMENSFILVKYRRIINGVPTYYETKVARVGGTLSNYVIIGYKNVDEETKRDLQKQEELSIALKEAQAANTAKTIFLNNMSHDIRTPMNAIIGYSKLAIKNLDKKDKVLHYLEKIDKSSVHLLSLINDVLDMSRIESGKMKIENTKVKLSTIIHEIMNIVESDIKTKSLHFYSEALNVIHDDLVTDKLRISQILLNLLSNAMKFTGYGGNIYLKIIEIPSKNKDYANFKITVKDSGIGMKPEFVKHIFEPFVRAESSTVTKILGTGLGMSIVKKIVDLLNGTISVESKEGYGTKFTIRLSLLIDKDSDNKNYHTFNNARALIIEDRTETCNSLVNTLKTINIRSDSSTSVEDLGDMAKRAIKENDPYKLYIINFTISHTACIDIIKTIRSLDSGFEPIIIINGYDWIDLDSEIVQKEHVHFISKPMFISDIKEILLKAQQVVDTENKSNLDYVKEVFQNKKILLAEDNEFNQEIAYEILTSQGLVVEVCENGLQAVEAIKSHDDNYYDLILMDIQMPVMDGYTATREIRKLDDKVKASIPIIAMTANAFLEDKVKALDSGMNDFLTKPIEIDKLFTILGKILAHKNL